MRRPFREDRACVRCTAPFTATARDVVRCAPCGPLHARETARATWRANVLAAIARRTTARREDAA